MTDLTPEAVSAWLRERQKNCERHAKTRREEDRAGWLDDAAYFGAAISLLAALERPGEEEVEALREESWKRHAVTLGKTMAHVSEDLQERLREVSRFLDRVFVLLRRLLAERAELKANEAAYERIVGQRTYQEVGDIIAERDAMLTNDSLARVQAIAEAERRAIAGEMRERAARYIETRDWWLRQDERQNAAAAIRALPLVEPKP